MIPDRSRTVRRPQGAARVAEFYVGLMGRPADYMTHIAGFDPDAVTNGAPTALGGRSQSRRVQRKKIIEHMQRNDSASPYQ